jgi:hypothetical protein
MDRAANLANAAFKLDPTLCTVRDGALNSGPANSKTLTTRKCSILPSPWVRLSQRRGSRVMRVLEEMKRSFVVNVTLGESQQNACLIMSRADEHKQCMGTSYVLCAACATARKPAKRALHQSFRDPLSRPPDSTVVIVNCGTSALQPLNMLRATTFCVRYQAGGRPMACRTGSRTRSDELFFEGGDTTSGQSSIECASES